MWCRNVRSVALLLALCFAPAGCAEGDGGRSAGEECLAEASAGEKPAARETPWGPVRVQLSASSKEFFLGQPIRLTLTVTNERNTPMRFRRVNIGADEPRMMHVSTDGRTFRVREFGSQLIPNLGHRVDSLQPGASRDYRLRILFSDWSADKLVFSKPGRYWIRMDFPLLVVGEGASQTSNLPSNAVEIRVTQPTGADAEVFDVLREEALFEFISGYGASPGTAKKTLDLIKAHPNSSYHADMKAALEAYYRIVTEHQMSRAQADPEWKALVEELREWLGIPDPDTLPFPDDKRLAVTFTTSFEGGVTFEEIFRRVSELTKVPLSVAPELAGLKMDAGLKERELREFMRNFGINTGDWVRDGDGYKLVPKPKEEAKPGTNGP